MKDTTKQPEAGKDPKDPQAADAGGIVAKCGSCATDQPVTHKCCSECGAQLAQASKAAYDAALQGLGAFHKSQTGLADRPEITPGDHQETKDVIAKARSAAGVDPSEIATVELLLGGQNNNTDLLTAVMNDVRAGRRDVGELAGLFMKALSAGLRAHEEAYTTAIQALTQRVDEWEASPGRSRTAGLQPFIKANSTQPPPAGTEDDSPSGDVLVKAAVQLGGARKLDPTDVTLTQQYANAGHTLRTIESADPALFRRLTAAGLQATA